MNFKYEECCLPEASSGPRERGASVIEEPYILAKKPACEHKQQLINFKNESKLMARWNDSKALYEVISKFSYLKMAEKEGKGSTMHLYISRWGHTINFWQVKETSWLKNCIILTKAYFHYLDCWYLQCWLRSLAIPFKIPYIFMS